MQDWKIDAVKDNLHRLCSKTNCNSELFAIIRKQKLIPISDHEKGELEAIPNEIERSYQFYEMIMKKDNFYDPLISALEEACQTGALKILMDAKENWEGFRESQKTVVSEPGTSNDLDFSELLKPLVLPPEQCTYYIPRTLCHRTELDPAVFRSRSTINHIFLFKGVKKSDLARLTGYAVIKSSGEQLCKVTETFILLECDGDFDWICKKTTNAVHMIQQVGESYFWVKSSGGMESISKYLKLEGKSVDEKEMAIKIMSTQAPRIFIISDSPGMGKTFILALLAKEIQNCSSNIMCIFFVLQEFAQKINLAKVNSSLSAIEAIAAYSTSDKISKSVFVEMLNNLHNQVYLFLDGYDEVVAEKLSAVDSFLKNLQELTNVKTIVTTRPHLQTRLENIFNDLAYGITPFDETNQVDFLTRYWTDMHQAVEGESLRKYARKCLKALASTLSDKEQEIAGIPLQCMMLAEVYAAYSKRASTLEGVDGCVVEPITFFEMYEKLVELKMQRITTTTAANSILGKVVGFFCETPSVPRNCANTHVKLAIELLFPEWIDEFKPILTGFDEVDESTLYAIGIIEKAPNGQRFVHRTIAEYIFSEFFVKNLGKHVQCLRLLYGEILGRKGTSKQTKTHNMPNLIHLTNEPRALELYGDSVLLKQPVIAYFINMHLNKSALKEFSFLPDCLTRSEVDVQGLCEAVETCCVGEFEHTFDFVAEVLQSLEITRNLRVTFFKYLPHLTLNHCKNHIMLEKALNFAKNKFNVDLSYHDLKDIPSFSNYTLLHAAVGKGKYSFATKLIERYGKDQVQELKCLLHACISKSEWDTSEVIEDKLLIIDMLVKEINPACIEEKDEDDRTVLHLDTIHFDLFKRLLELGAMINGYSKFHGTVLHCANTDKTNYMNRVRFSLSNGFKLINRTDAFQITPLMLALQSHCIDEDELQTFIDAGADLHAVDDLEDSVLFYALANSESLDVISKLVRLGVDINHTNAFGQNSAHRIMSNFNLDSSQILQILKLLHSEGFREFQKKDVDGQMPLNIVRSEVLDSELISFLEKGGQETAEINQENTSHN